MTIKNKFEIGQEVWLKTDPDQYTRIVTEIRITPGALMYSLSCSDECSIHFDFEISDTKGY